VAAYQHALVEAKWRKRWQAQPPNEIDLSAVAAAQKFYNLVEFPYPSAEGLHVGHVYTYCGADVLGRYARMTGRQVFQPIGFDSFGIQTEAYARRLGENPDVVTRRNIPNFRRQLESIGVGWNWEAALTTSDPAYYRWTQWIFVKLLRAGLAVRRESELLLCPNCQTAPTTHQVEGDRCDSCGSVMTPQRIKQWYLRITAYADELLDSLDTLDWPEVSKRLQREWIGRSDGAEVHFPIEGRPGRVITAFTTRVDTLYGVTFLGIAPDHRQANELSGLRALHPITGRLLPVYVADYALAEHGTGVVMGVPAHDDRDFLFAKMHGIEIVNVVRPVHNEAARESPFTADGILINSGEFTGLTSAEARRSITSHLSARGLGGSARWYRLHDWLVSRPRFWGTPIPVIYCAECGAVPVPEDQLPVRLPPIDSIRPDGSGLSPLARVAEFVNAACPSCGAPARRETDVLDTFVESAWYFLRYPSHDLDDVPWSEDRTARLLPVDFYAGGLEHATRHHLYARFMTKALADLNYLPFREPFKKLRLHGLITLDGAKMSKSRGNVVSPDTYIPQVGADNLRAYLLFSGPWERGGDFNDASLHGIVRFTKRAFRLLSEPFEQGTGGVDMRPLDRFIARVEADIRDLRFNTALSQLMEAVNWLAGVRTDMSNSEWHRASRAIVLLLAPFVPHLAEELWERLGEAYSVHQQMWPRFDPDALTEEMVVVVVQVNGRTRDAVNVPRGTSREELFEIALGRDAVARHIPHAAEIRTVFVRDRVLNIVPIAG
jgi:leucyl-tRNA synthetase